MRDDLEKKQKKIDVLAVKLDKVEQELVRANLALEQHATRRLNRVNHGRIKKGWPPIVCDNEHLINFSPKRDLNIVSRLQRKKAILEYKLEACKI